jgi:phage terminase large subunit
MKFLSDDIDEIIIDPIRCPNTAREFTSYELEKDKNGNFKGSYPDKDNHTIDAVRYAMEDEMTMRKARIRSKKAAGIR